METIKNNYLVMAAILITFLLGGLIGYYAFYRVGPIAQVCDISYVSYDEIMALERKRIEDLKFADNDKSLFFGRAKEVIARITAIANNYRSNKTKVILTSGSIRGNNVRSISSEVHGKIIAELKGDSND